MKNDDHIPFLCLNCGNSLFLTVLEKMIGVYAGLDEYKILRCKFCHLLATNPRPSQNQLELIYKNHYGYDFHRTVSWEKKRRAQKLLKMIDSIVDFSNVSSFLELGCANGELSKILYKKYKLIGVGVDLIAPENSKKLEEDEGVKFVRKAIDAYLETTTEVFDTIILSHTLEHLLDPRSSLDLIRKRLDIGGFLIVVVPNALVTRNKFWGYWQVPVHISHFDENSLQSLLIKCGFEPIYFATASIDFLGVGLSVLNLFKTRKSPRQGRVITFITGLLSFFWPMFYNLGNSDLIMIAKSSNVPRQSKENTQFQS